jgi:hypothetical protein
MKSLQITSIYRTTRSFGEMGGVHYYDIDVHCSAKQFTVCDFSWTCVACFIWSLSFFPVFLLLDSCVNLFPAFFNLLNRF